ncbi:MAG: ATP-binding protein [Shimia sp.]
MLALSLTSTLEDLATLDTALRAACAERGLPERGVARLRLVVEELFVNIITHASPSPDAQVDIRLEQDGASVVVTLADRGPPFAPTETRARTPEEMLDPEASPGGHGSHLVAAMTRDLTFRREGGLTVTRARVAMEEPT